jgi:hypothetical protein
MICSDLKALNIGVVSVTAGSNASRICAKETINDAFLKHHLYQVLPMLVCHCKPYVIYLTHTHIVCCIRLMSRCCFRGGMSFHHLITKNFPSLCKTGKQSTANALSMMDINLHSCKDKCVHIQTFIQGRLPTHLLIQAYINNKHLINRRAFLL